MASVCEKLAQSLRLLLLLVVLGGHACCSRVGALTVDDLYPFGAENGDTVLRDHDLGTRQLSAPILLPYTMPLFGAPNPVLNATFVSLDGAIFFRNFGTNPDPYNHIFPAVGYHMVAPFWTNLEATCSACTGIAFRVVGDAALLAVLTSDIRGAFPSEALAAGFTAESALIATWVNVTAYSDREFVYTFQAVIVFTKDTVFVGLLYPKLPVAKLDIIHHGGVQAGFNLGDGVRSFRLPTSFSTASFDKLSNVGEAGKWWFGLGQRGTTIGTFAYIDKPLPSEVCSEVQLYGDAGVDACGNQRVMNWDLNDDGAFDDATNTTVPSPINTDTLRLAPGTYPIHAQVRSPSSCPGDISDLLVLNNTLMLNGTPRIKSMTAYPKTGNPKPSVGETMYVVRDFIVIPCNDYVETINCGAGSIAGEQPGFCRYSTPGVKTITDTITQSGLTVSRAINITVVEYKPACLGQYPPGGRAIGRRACSVGVWAQPESRCQYPVRAGVKPSTKLWLAFASRAPEDAAVIRRLYGNRTMEEALNRYRSQADEFAGEAAAALLNALTLPYPYCPRTVKIKFRRALYFGITSQEVSTVLSEFRGFNIFLGCLDALPACS